MKQYAHVTLHSDHVKDTKCEETIISGLKSMKGINDIAVNTKTQLITVQYLPSKTNVVDIQHELATLGYPSNQVN